MDRTDYVADHLLKRRRLLEDALLLENASWDESERRREELVARVLVFEAGIGDAESVRMVLEAMPPISADTRCTEFECAEFARFLRDAIAFGST